MIPRAMMAPCLLTAVALAGCGRINEADRLLADAGAASTTLASYYEDLGIITLDGWQEQAVFDALQGNDAAPAAEYQDRLKAFQQRADFAHHVTLVYASLRQLHDPSGVNRVTAEGKNLGTAIQGLTTIKGAKEVPSDQLAGAAAFLLKMHRERDLRRGLSEMTRLTDGIETMFHNEQSVYLSVSRDRTHLAQRLLAKLKDEKLVNPAQFLQQLHLGVAVANSGSDAAAVTAGMAIAAISAERTDLAWQCATQHTQAVVTILAATERTLLTEQTRQLSNLEDEITQAAACIKDHQDLTKASK